MWRIFKFIRIFHEWYDILINILMLYFQALEDSNILLKGITSTIKNETKEQKGGFLGMFLGTLGAKLLGDILTNRKRNVNSRL